MYPDCIQVYNPVSVIKLMYPDCIQVYNLVSVFKLTYPDWPAKEAKNKMSDEEYYEEEEV